MAENFEAKKHAYRQTQDGIVISFVCHPSDLAAALALAPLGTRYMVAVAEIGDDEKPVEPAPAKERKPFDSLPLSQQAAIRCQDNDFKLYLGVNNAEEAAQKLREFCRIGSRSELDDPTKERPRHDFLAMQDHYQAWLTTQQYGSLVR